MSQEKKINALPGWTMLCVCLAFLLLVLGAMINGIIGGHSFLVIIGVFTLPLSIILLMGFFTLQPNEARVMLLFGEYKGVVRDSGFFWANPFYSRSRGGSVSKEGQAVVIVKGESMTVSLRARNFESQKIKVNDKGGNPIEIAAVIVWRVKDAAMAMFDVDCYESYIQVQSETAVRHLASSYYYDNDRDGEITLRGGADEISAKLRGELEDRLSLAGVTVDDARLTHLAYAPEIAQVMLRRQQAEAIIAAREKLVCGAVGMVELALNQLSERKVVELDDERKAAMVSNLLVVLCGETEAQPVINAGTLYQ